MTSAPRPSSALQQHIQGNKRSAAAPLQRPSAAPLPGTGAVQHTARSSGGGPHQQPTAPRTTHRQAFTLKIGRGRGGARVNKEKRGNGFQLAAAASQTASQPRSSNTINNYSAPRIRFHLVHSGRRGSRVPDASRRLDFGLSHAHLFQLTTLKHAGHCGKQKETHLKIYVSVLVHVERSEDVVTKLLGVPAGEEHFVHVHELGRRQLPVGAVLLQQGEKRKHTVKKTFGGGGRTARGTRTGEPRATVTGLENPLNSCKAVPDSDSESLPPRTPPSERTRPGRGLPGRALVQRA